MANGGPQLLARLSLDPTSFEKNLIRVVVLAQQQSAKISKLPFKIPTLGITAATKALKGFAATLASIGGGLSGMGASFLMGGWQGIGASIAGVGTKLATGTQDAYEYGRAMMNLSRATGIQAERMASLSLAMEDSQIQANEVIMAIKMMDQLFLKASHGVESSVHAFQQIGLNWKEIMHLPVDEAFEKVGARIAAIENPALRSAAAITIFGRTGAKMLKLFERGGALEMAKEALGSQAGIIGKDGWAFEKIAIRMSHIGVKVRGIFVGIADAILPMVDKFSDKFHKMDFTSWGLKIGNAVNEGMAWMVTFWEHPGQTMDFFWESAKLKAMELGATLLNAVDKAFPGMADSISDMVLKTQAWGKIIVGYAVDFGQHMLAGVQTFIAAFKEGWEATGIPEVMRWMKTKDDTDRKYDKAHSFSPEGYEVLHEHVRRSNRPLSNEDIMQAKVDSWGKAAMESDPNSFDNILKKIQGNNSGSALTKQGEADLAKAHGEAVARSFAVFFPSLNGGQFSGASRMQAALEEQRRKAALAGAPLVKPLSDARAALGQNRFTPAGSRDYADFTGAQLKDVYGNSVAATKGSDWRKAFTTGERRNHMGSTGVMGALLGGPMGMAARATNMAIEGASAMHNKAIEQSFNAWRFTGEGSMSGMHAGAYGQGGVLGSRELNKFRSSKIAARAGRILASGGQDISDAQYRAAGGDYSDRRRPGETANGDRKRAQAFAKEAARREAGQGTDNQLLGDISRNTAKGAKLTDLMFPGGG